MPMTALGAPPPLPPPIFATVAAALDAAPQLRRLVLCGCRLGASLSLLPALPRLEVLDLSYNDLAGQGGSDPPAVAAVLQRLHGLRDLDLHCCELVERDIAAVAAALPPGLHRLRLSSDYRCNWRVPTLSAPTAAALATALLRCAQLQTLDCTNVPVLGSDAAVAAVLPAIGRLTCLRELQLHGTCGGGYSESSKYAPDAGLLGEALHGLTDLRCLQLSTRDLMSDDSVLSLEPSLSRLSRLTELHLCQRGGSTRGWAHAAAQLAPALGRMTGLRELRLGCRDACYNPLFGDEDSQELSMWPLVKSRSVKQVERRLERVMGVKRYVGMTVFWGIDIQMAEEQEETAARRHRQCSQWQDDDY